jgi:Na+-driven multidrug efflux pump
MASILARRLGAGNREGARDVFTAAHALALVIVAVLNVIYWTLGPHVIGVAADGDGEVAANARLFMSVMIAFAPIGFFLSLNVDALRCEGKLGFMTLLTLAASLLNIAANGLFMAVFHWGVPGSAAGSIASQFVCLTAILLYRWRQVSALRVAMKSAAAEWKGIIALGAPMSLGFIGISLGSAAIIFNLSVWSPLGYVVTVGAYGIITRIMTFAYLPLLGLNIAFQTISGHNHGAGRPERVRRSLQFALIAALIYCASVELIVEMLAGRLHLRR